MTTTEYTGPSNIGTTRWNPQLEQYYKGESTEPSYRPTMTPDIVGRYVLARDYDALAARLAEVETQLKMVLDREAATYARHDAKLEAAEAKLAKVVAAGVRVRNYYENHGNRDVYAVADFNAAIAELKGENQ